MANTMYFQDCIDILPAWTEKMRALGVKRMEYRDGNIAVELFEPAPETIPAPPMVDEPELEAETKEPGICAHGGCEQPAGWHLAPGFCRRHGLSACGVRS